MAWDDTTVENKNNWLADALTWADATFILQYYDHVLDKYFNIEGDY